MKKINKKWILFFLICFVGAAAIFLCSRKNPQNHFAIKGQHIKHRIAPYFFPISLSEFSSTGAPCLPIQVEGQVVPAMLDLGFQGWLSCESEFLTQIKNKKYLDKQVTMRQFQGGKYEKAIYQIPFIKVGAITFSDSPLYEDSVESKAECIILKNDQAPSDPLMYLGWRVFEITNLFLDLEKDMIAYCDSIQTLQEQGYPIDAFTKVPLSFDRGFIECEVKTTDEVLRCVLDTGATGNILNRELEANQTMADVVRSNKRVVYDHFEFSGQDFGPVSFAPLPIRFPFHVDCFLGMEFFNTHIVFLDFSEKCAYFCKSTATL